MRLLLLGAILVFGCGLTGVVGRYNGLVTSTIRCEGVTTGPTTYMFPTTWMVEENEGKLVVRTGGRCSPLYLAPISDTEYTLDVKTCLPLVPVGRVYLSSEGLLVDSIGQLIYSTFTWLPNRCTSTERAVFTRQK